MAEVEITVNDVVRVVPYGTYKEMSDKREFPEVIFCLQRGEKFFLDEPTPHNFKVYDLCGNLALVKKEKGAWRMEVLIDPKFQFKVTKLPEVKGYEDLTRILDEALQQATSGKGKERHAGNKPFDKQPIMEIARMTGLAYQTGQAMKKIQESHTLLEIKGKEAAINELRGAIIYLAAAIKKIEED